MEWAKGIVRAHLLENRALMARSTLPILRLMPYGRNTYNFIWLLYIATIG
jgi:hypothetical protein